MLFGVELDELLQKDHEQGDTDHAYEANTYTCKTTQMRFWVIVSIAHSSHCHETHPNGVYEVSEVLWVVAKFIRLFTGLYDKCSDDTNNKHH